MGADEKLNSIEYELFNEIVDEISKEALRIQETAGAVAYIDVLCSLSYVATRNNYVCPVINTQGHMEIKDGRHPVVELMLNDGSFIANNTSLNNTNERVAIITGPNMAGKSTYMRQVALITLMAQIGSFVPARSANISVCDRIFTRVGASDDLAGGQSTFMVEMSEVANILKNATKDSLLILDEIGRGTSTYDGLSIAWAVVEYISDKKKLGAKALFATHYHELTELEGKLKGVHNYCIAVKENDNDLIFLRKIIPGGADKSYGIAVARLAGVPEDIIKRADEIAYELSLSDIVSDNRNRIKKLSTETCVSEEAIYVNANTPKNTDDEYKCDIDTERMLYETAERIRNTDLNKLTPMEAMFLLNELQEKLK